MKFFRIGSKRRFAAASGFVLVLVVVSLPGKASALKGGLIVLGLLIILISGVHWIVTRRRLANGQPEPRQHRAEPRSGPGLLGTLPVAWQVVSFLIGIAAITILVTAIGGPWPVSLLIAALFAVVFGSLVRLTYKMTTRNDT